MILGDGGEHVEMAVAPLGDGDFVVSILARVGEFAGAAEGVVVGHAWEGFLHDLRGLERDRRGDAELRSAGFDELRVRIFATDKAGHVAVEGELSDPGTSEDSVLRLQFGPIAFDPSLLPQLVAALTTYPAPPHER